MYDKHKHENLSKERESERQFSHVVRVSSVNKLNGRHGKLITGYKMVSGRGFRNK